MTKEITLEVLPKDSAEQIDRHVNNIQTFLAGETKSSAEFFAYAFLVGKEAINLRTLLNHGNSGDPNAGIMNLLQARFPKTPYRTLSRRMDYAQRIMSAAATLPPLKKRPLFLSNGEITEKDRGAMLKVIPLVMDGKSMMAFMRDSRLLNDPKKPKHHNHRPVSKQEENKAKNEQAKRIWKAIRTSLATALKVRKRLDAAEIKTNIDALVDAGNALRAELKRIGGETK